MRAYFLADFMKVYHVAIRLSVWVPIVENDFDNIFIKVFTISIKTFL